MKKISILVLWLTCINNVCCETEPMSNQNDCVQEKVAERKYICIGRYGCGDYTLIINKTINCHNISLNSLKLYHVSTDDNYGINYDLTLKVADSEILVLPPHVFKNFRKLIILILEEINLETVMPAAFTSLDDIKEIYLRKNKLATIPDGLFNTLMSLEKLDLSENILKTVSNHAFVGVNLKKLNLNNNRISVLGEILINSIILDISHNNLRNVSTLHGLSVQKLNLSHNDIKMVDFEVFSKIPTFIDISVNNITNKIPTVIDISFNNINVLRNLSLLHVSAVMLSHNKIDTIEKNDELSILDMSYNNLKTIRENVLSPNLLKLNASSNSISSLAGHAFFGLYQLTHLFLDNNNISSIPNSCFKDLKSLTHLNISGNKLTSFKFGTFDSLLNLEVLDISNNKLKELPQFTLHSLTKLTHLHFQNNEIDEINIDDLTQHLGSLLYIDLDNNIWSCQKLANIIHTLKRYKISFPDGNSWEENNIHGIQCYEIFANRYLDNMSKSSGESKINKLFNEDFTKTLMYKYFNKDFQNSYMYNYFNKDFKNSSFFEYLENFKAGAPNADKLEKSNDNELREIATSFKNISLELENILKENKSHYPNKDNGMSRIEKYLENINNVKTEKLISPVENAFESPNYTGLLSTIATLLLIIICIMAIVAYRQFFYESKYNLARKEEVELI